MRKGTIKTLTIVGVTSMMLLAQPMMPATVQQMNLFGTTAYAAEVAPTKQIRVTLDGKVVVFPDQQPVVVDGRTMIPVRGLFDTSLGWEITWHQDQNAASLKKGNKTIFVPIGQQYLMVKETGKPDALSGPLDVPAQVIGGRTMIPLAAVGTLADLNIQWDATNYTAVLTQKTATSSKSLVSPKGTPGPHTPGDDGSFSTVEKVKQYTGFTDIPIEIYWDAVNGWWVAPAVRVGVDGCEFAVLSSPTNKNRGWVNPEVELADRAARADLKAKFGTRDQIRARYTKGGPLTNDEYYALAKNAPNLWETRSSMVMDETWWSVEQRQAWIDEYYKLGGPNIAEIQYVAKLNEFREAAGLKPVMLSIDMSVIARFNAQHLSDLKYFSHTVKVYGNFSGPLGMTGKGAGAELLHGGSYKNDLQGMPFEHSPDHWKHLMNPNLIAIGVGNATTADGTGGKFVVNLYGANNPDGSQHTSRDWNGVLEQIPMTNPGDHSKAIDDFLKSTGH